MKMSKKLLHAAPSNQKVAISTSSEEVRTSKLTHNPSKTPIYWIGSAWKPSPRSRRQSSREPTFLQFKVSNWLPPRTTSTTPGSNEENSKRTEMRARSSLRLRTHGIWQSKHDDRETKMKSCTRYKSPGTPRLSNHSPTALRNANRPSKVKINSKLSR